MTTTAFLLVQTRLIALYDAEGQAKNPPGPAPSERPQGSLPHLRPWPYWPCASHQYDIALGFLEALAKYWPNDLYQLRARGVCLLLMGHNRQAEQVFKQALDLKPDDQDSLLALGQAYQREGQLDSARQVLAKFG